MSVIERIDAIDQAVSRRMVARAAARAGERPAGWVVALHRFSQAGSYGIGWVVLFALVVTFVEGPLVAAVAAGCVLGTLMLNTAVKLVLRRPRPVANPVGHVPRTFSLPSAHTSMAVVGAALMAVVVPQLLWLWVAIAVALGASRVILGMHFLFDVLAGAALGALLAWLLALPLLALVRAG